MVYITIKEVCEMLDGLKLYFVITDFDFDRANIGVKVKGGFLVEDECIDSLEDCLMVEYSLLTDDMNAEFSFLVL